MPHRFDVIVRWSDEDRLGHVNNARYLTFTEDARLVWLADSPAGSGGVILARTEVDFRSQVHFAAGGRLVVQTWVTAIGRSSAGLRQDIHRVDAPDGVATTADPAQVLADPVATTANVLVCYDYRNQRSRPWTEEERAWLRTWMDQEGG
ncbi:MAG: acyl-CoA thioesterase [Geodermatophilaceae bacterium]